MSILRLAEKCTPPTWFAPFRYPPSSTYETRSTQPTVVRCTLTTPRTTVMIAQLTRVRQQDNSPIDANSMISYPQVAACRGKAPTWRHATFFDASHQQPKPNTTTCPGWLPAAGQMDLAARECSWLNRMHPTLIHHRPTRITHLPAHPSTTVRPAVLARPRPSHRARPLPPTCCMQHASSSTTGTAGTICG